MSQFTPRCAVLHDYERGNRRTGAGPRGPQAGRKDGGKHVMAFFDLVKTSSRNRQDAEFDANFMEAAKAASKDLPSCRHVFHAKRHENPEQCALGVERHSMHMFGHVCLGLMWAKMGLAANQSA